LYQVTALKERLVHVDGDCNSIPGIPTVVHVIAASVVVDIHIIGVVPIVRPVFRPRVHETEPKTAVLEARIPAIHLYGVAVDAERVISTKVATIAVLWNVVAVVAPTLLPVAMFGLPVMCAMFLPDSLLLASLSMLLLL
jgi:hypothetical protein